MTIAFIYSIILPILLSLLITPWVIRFAKKIGATDAPGERKVHTTEMPRIGGLAIFISFSISALTIYLLFPEVFTKVSENIELAAVLVFCFVSLFALGFRDDLKPLSPEIKFGVQLLLAAIIYFAGFKISNITNPMGAGLLDVGIIDFPLTIIWIVGITNAFNLIDGLDGLAAGVAVIASISIFIVSVMAYQYETAVIALIIAGSLIGFLRYNFNPAKIFLGDSGSLLIGFSLAILSIQSTAKITTGFALLFPILVLVLPITDTLVSMIRRLLGSFLKQNPESASLSSLRRLYGMFIPDKSHIHHRLLSLGLSHRNTVLVLYFVSVFFAFSAFLFIQINTSARSVTIAILLGVLLVLCIKKLRYYEIAIFNNGLMMPFYEKWILNRISFVRLADVCFITTSFFLSYVMLNSLIPASLDLVSIENTILWILPLQLIVMWLTGLYREKMNPFGIGNILNISASIAYAVGLTAVVFAMMEILPLVATIQFLILDFYFLLTFVLGFRMTYQSLIFWYNRDKPSGKNVLIYGAGQKGISLLHSITSSPDNNIKVLGFLDDDPAIKGKLINGFPILGGHWEVAKTYLNKNVDTIYLCDESVKSENLRRLKTTAQQQGITVKKLHMSFQEVETKVHKEKKKRRKKPDNSVASYHNSNILSPD
jgi:UDP-GlcNAc:undecaprenyl-phosphate/decaprenyl-phosphate GlcNAc-1-phosphate transferase